MTPLPYDAEVEYLESTGTQYIDTGFVPDDSCGMSVRFSNSTGVLKKVIAGTGKDGIDNRWFVYNAATNRIQFGWNINGYNTYVSGGGIWIGARLNYLNDRKTVVNGVEGTLNLPTLNEVKLSAYLFAQNIKNAPGNAFVGRISNIQFTRGNQVVMNFIPVIKNNIGYMYDKVSGRLFGNIGTGNFIVGPRKSNQ